jgi:hypothetical protein
MSGWNWDTGRWDGGLCGFGLALSYSLCLCLCELGSRVPHPQPTDPFPPTNWSLLSDNSTNNGVKVIEHLLYARHGDKAFLLLPYPFNSSSQPEPRKATPAGPAGPPHTSHASTQPGRPRSTIPSPFQAKMASLCVCFPLWADEGS